MRHSHAPESVITNLLSHFARSSPNIFKEGFCGEIVDPEQDFPDSVS